MNKCATFVRAEGPFRHHLFLPCYNLLEAGVKNRRQALARAREFGLLQSVTPVLPAGGAPEARPGQAIPTGTVTFLFTDIEGSTPLWEHEPEKMSAALLIHHAALRRAIQANGCVVFKTVGETFPTAPQALKAAIQSQREIKSAPWNELGPLKVRMGLHTGEAQLDTGVGEYAVSHTKNRAARIMAAAQGGRMLLSVEAADLCTHSLPPGVRFMDLGERRIKGLAQSEHLFQALAPGLQEDFPPLATQPGPKHNLPRRRTPFVGRAEKLRTREYEFFTQSRSRPFSALCCWVGANEQLPNLMLSFVLRASG